MAGLEGRSWVQRSEANECVSQCGRKSFSWSRNEVGNERIGGIQEDGCIRRREKTSYMRGAGRRVQGKQMAGEGPASLGK